MWVARRCAAWSEGLSTSVVVGLIMHGGFHSAPVVQCMHCGWSVGCLLPCMCPWPCPHKGQEHAISGWLALHLSCLDAYSKSCELSVGLVARHRTGRLLLSCHAVLSASMLMLHC